MGYAARGPLRASDAAARRGPARLFALPLLLGLVACAESTSPSDPAVSGSGGQAGPATVSTQASPCSPALAGLRPAESSMSDAALSVHAREADAPDAELCPGESPPADRTVVVRLVAARSLHVRTLAIGTDGSTTPMGAADGVRLASGESFEISVRPADQHVTGIAFVVARGDGFATVAVPHGGAVDLLGLGWGDAHVTPIGRGAYARLDDGGRAIVPWWFRDPNAFRTIDIDDDPL